MNSLSLSTGGFCGVSWLTNSRMGPDGIVTTQRLAASGPIYGRLTHTNIEPLCEQDSETIQTSARIVFAHDNGLQSTLEHGVPALQDFTIYLEAEW